MGPKLPKLLQYAFIALMLGVILLTVSLFMKHPIPILATFTPGAGCLAIGFVLVAFSMLRVIRKKDEMH